MTRTDALQQISREIETIQTVAVGTIVDGQLLASEARRARWLEQAETARATILRASDAVVESLRPGSLWNRDGLI